MVFSLPLLVALVLLTLTPGADTALIIRNSARYGMRDAVITSVGICCGLFVHALLTGLGLSAVLLSTPWAFGVLRVLGAGYLIYLGSSSVYCAVRSRKDDRGKHDAVDMRNEDVKATSGAGVLSAWRQGFLSNVLNPKTLGFYLAFLPQFVDTRQALLPQALAIAALHFVIAMAWQTMVARLTIRGAKAGDGAKAHWLEVASGLTLIAIGLSLFITS